MMKSESGKRRSPRLTGAGHFGFGNLPVSSTILGGCGNGGRTSHCDRHEIAPAASRPPGSVALFWARLGTRRLCGMAAIRPGPAQYCRRRKGRCVTAFTRARRGCNATTPSQKPEASSARRETTLQREIAVKNVSLGIFDPARCRRNPDFLGGFPPKPRSVLRDRQGIPRLSGVSSRARRVCLTFPASRDQI